MTGIHRVTQGHLIRDFESEIIPESIPLELETWLNVNGENWLGFHCSPSDLESLAAGFLFNEAIIHQRSEIETIHVCENKSLIEIWLDHTVTKPETWSRTSGCLGGVQIRDTALKISPLPFAMISIEKITEGIRTFLDNISSKEMQRNGVHTSILINNNQVLYCSNDIGRHNTLDKISGFCLINSIEITNSMLITTGRISSDMVIKSLRMKVPVVISLHSASVAAQELAVENGLILICHARKPEFTVLGGFERIQLTD